MALKSEPLNPVGDGTSDRYDCVSSAFGSNGVWELDDRGGSRVRGVTHQGHGRKHTQSEYRVLDDALHLQMAPPG
jgi:hypothetical protein